MSASTDNGSSAASGSTPRICRTPGCEVELGDKSIGFEHCTDCREEGRDRVPIGVVPPATLVPCPGCEGARAERDAARRFPIQRGPSILWSVIAPHERQARRNHGEQTLQRLAERGGLDPIEALAVIEDRDYPWRADDATLAEHRARFVALVERTDREQSAMARRAETAEAALAAARDRCAEAEKERDAAIADASRVSGVCIEVTKAFHERTRLAEDRCARLAEGLSLLRGATKEFHDEVRERAVIRTAQIAPLAIVDARLKVAIDAVDALLAPAGAEAPGRGEEKCSTCGGSGVTGIESLSPSDPGKERMVRFLPCPSCSVPR